MSEQYPQYNDNKNEIQHTETEHCTLDSDDAYETQGKDGQHNELTYRKTLFFSNNES